MNTIIKDACARHHILPCQFFGAAKGKDAAMARRDAIRDLSRTGLGPKAIAYELRVHLQTVYYWLKPWRRAQIRKQSHKTYLAHKAEMRA
jgi:hypothetical protein